MTPPPAPQVMAYLIRVPFLQRKMLGFISQLRINYAASPLSSQCDAGSAAAKPMAATANAATAIPLEAGRRAPDVQLNPETQDGAAAGAPVRLYELLRGPHHTLLAFGEPGDALGREAAALQARFGARLRVVHVCRGRPDAEPYPTRDTKADSIEASAGKVAAHANGRACADYTPSINPNKATIMNAAPANGHAALAASPMVCIDVSCKAHARYGVTAACGFLIRPDGYIGVACAPAGVLTDEVARRFVE